MTLGRRSFATAAALAVAALALPACSGGAASVKTANVTPADMPEGADWTGVYFNQLYGYFHLVQEGKTISGKWIRPQRDKWGELHGEATGNVVKFTWTEYVVGGVGPNSQKDGKGYFVYSRPEGDNVDDRLDGEMGRGQDEVGEKVDLVKQRNVMPDLASIGGTGAGDISGGDWDQEGKESGTPEAPAPPP